MCWDTESFASDITAFRTDYWLIVGAQSWTATNPVTVSILVDGESAAQTRTQNSGPGYHSERDDMFKHWYVAEVTGLRIEPGDAIRVSISRWSQGPYYAYMGPFDERFLTQG